MGKALKYEIKQSQPFANLEEEVVLNLECTNDHFRHQVQMVLRHFGLTSTQYSALRILQEKGQGGMACTELGRCLISSDPDITRLLDRLAKQKLVRRRREFRDRRLVLTEISEEGARLLETIIPLLNKHMSEAFQHMQQHRLRLLVELLEEARHSHLQSSETGMLEMGAALASASRAG